MDLWRWNDGEKPKQKQPKIRKNLSKPEAQKIPQLSSRRGDAVQSRKYGRSGTRGEMMHLAKPWAFGISQKKPDFSRDSLCLGKNENGSLSPLEINALLNDHSAFCYDMWSPLIRLLAVGRNRNVMATAYKLPSVICTPWLSRLRIVFLLRSDNGSFNWVIVRQSWFGVFRRCYKTCWNQNRPLNLLFAVSRMKLLWD